MFFHFRRRLRGMVERLAARGRWVTARHDLVTNDKVPVDWTINPAKTNYAFNSPATSLDFTATITTGTKSYSGEGRSLR